ncbi:MAG TPA: fatty acid--CoA ligase family protein, partial [Gammaproteobacteria bacterium]|nr:fatty acid--CoA ligase family protein [Gammaproteobacteria bacterium]
GLPVPPRDSEPRSYDGEDSLIRLALSSGTTGRSKIIAVSLARLLLLCENTSALWRRNGREMTLLPLSAQLAYINLIYQLLSGGTLFCGEFEDRPALLNLFQVEYVFGSPMQLLGLCTQLSGEDTYGGSLKMAIYLGGQASPRLLDRVRSVLCSSVVCLYGSTEVGGVSLFHVNQGSFLSGEAGYVAPEAQVQIVDEQHRPLGSNREGTVRTRTSHMATGYYADEEATRCYFRDGWFYPGDRGWLREDGMLVLTGREKELINRGGVKVDPAAIDQRLLDYEEIEDAAAFGFENAMGMEDVAVAVVLNREIATETVRKSLVQSLGLSYSPSAFVCVDVIPRNEMGKPVRAALRDRYAGKLRAYAKQR